MAQRPGEPHLAVVIAQPVLPVSFLQTTLSKHPQRRISQVSSPLPPLKGSIPHLRKDAEEADMKETGKPQQRKLSIQSVVLKSPVVMRRSPSSLFGARNQTSELKHGSRDHENGRTEGSKVEEIPGVNAFTSLLRTLRQKANGNNMADQLGALAETMLKTKWSRRPRRPDLGRKFRAAAWISIIIRRLCLANLRNSEDDDSPYMKGISFVDNLVKESKGSDLLFSVDEFKANRELRMSEISKRILTNPSWARSQHDLLHVEIVLRSIKDFADYPVTIQRKIATTGEYRKYEARRIIVREGHPAWNFYFILSGSVVILVMDDQRQFVRPKAILKRGESFGDLALINKERRRSTVVAMEDVEMLSIWHEDYHDIFMNGGTLKSEDEFIRNLPFMFDWPLQKADEADHLFRYHFYKRGDVVVRDSHHSPWIIVVKSGSLSVLKRLLKVQAFAWKKKKPQSEDNKFPYRSNEEQEGMTPASSDHTESTLVKSPPVKQLVRKHTLKKIVTSKEVSRQETNEIAVSSLHQEIITAATDLDSGFQKADHPPVESDLHPMFVQIQTLTKGKVFGLYDVVLGQQPSFCVISNGAECVMINRHFFCEHLTEEALKRIRYEAQAYPSDEELQSNLQTAVDWVAYKAATLLSAVKRKQRHHVQQQILRLKTDKHASPQPNR